MSHHTHFAIPTLPIIKILGKSRDHVNLALIVVHFFSEKIDHLITADHFSFCHQGFYFLIIFSGFG
jgi:hypothetical protein